MKETPHQLLAPAMKTKQKLEEETIANTVS